MELSTVAIILAAYYRLVGTETEDPALEEQGETDNQVAYEFLTRGCRRAQRWMWDVGYKGWRTRTSALSFTGSDDTDGGRKVTLPSDFARTFGSERRSALVEPDGTRWGQQIDAEEDNLRGNVYYLRGEELWLGRGAAPPTTLYLDYHYLHPAWSGSVTLDFPLQARPLIVAEAAFVAKNENWLLGGIDLEQKIREALLVAREEARGICRQTKGPRQMRKVRRMGNHW